MANFYLALCVVGVVVPYGFFLPWLIDNGLNISLFITELVSTRVGAFCGADVIVAGVALFGFMFADGHRAGMKWLRAPVVGTHCVGVSLGLPPFLYLRERSRVTAR